MRSLLPLLSLFLLSGAPAWYGANMVSAHPGGIAYGRAICGSEYTTPEEPYVVPDIKEAWYLRLISTCENPYHWVKFDIVDANQQLYIAAISPEIARFQDKIRFNGILYGPGVSSSQDGMSEMPAALPAGVTQKTGPGFENASYITSPADLGVCDFVKTNPVMRNYAKVIGGRCMEELKLDQNYKDKLQAQTTTFSWWLYSFNHRAVQPGTYYLQTWLTDSTTNAVAQGKYEVTLAPWSWSGYASQAVQVEAQAQGTDCSCAVNAQSYKENYPERLGGLDPVLYEKELPGGSCDAGPPPATTCVTQARRQYVSEGSAIEWAGIFSLAAGRTYEWTFRAYYNGGLGTFEYPDPGMDVFIAPASTLSAAMAAADAALKGAPAASVAAEGTLAIAPVGSQISQFIEFTDPMVAEQTRVLLKPTADGDVAVMTQHVPTEFMAHFLVDRESGAYVFPKSATLYGELGGAYDDPTTSEPVIEPGPLKLEVTATLEGMTLDAFDAAAEIVFRDQVAAIFAGKDRSHVSVTNKQDVTLRRLLASGLKVDYTVDGFEDEAAVTAAASTMESKNSELVTSLQQDAAGKFSALTGITNEFRPIPSANHAGERSSVCWPLLGALAGTAWLRALQAQ